MHAPLEPSFNVNLTGFADEVRAVSADFAVWTLGLGQATAAAP